VRHFGKVRTVDEFLKAKARLLGQTTASSHHVAGVGTDVDDAAKVSSGGYVDRRIVELIKPGQSRRWDCTKLLGLIQELDDNYREDNGYAAHALLRAILDHVPPLFAQSGFAGVVDSHSWSRTDRKYVRQLAAFRAQADDVLHRQISGSPDLLTVEDMPPRAAVNSFLRECARQL
jgi:hypothetical protein